MKITTKLVFDIFNEYNKKIFNGILPRPEIELCDVKSYHGKMKSDGHGPDAKYTLSINTRYPKQRVELEDVIIHEMIHQYLKVINKKDLTSHGPKFKAMMNMINIIWDRHITVSIIVNDESLIRVKGEVRCVCAVKFTDGRNGFKVVPRQVRRIIEFYKLMDEWDEVESFSFYIIRSEFFMNYPNSVNPKITILEDQERLRKELRGAIRVICDGKSVETGEIVE